MKIGDFNALTGEQIVRDANADEIAQREKDIVDKIALQKLEDEAKSEAAAAKAALLAKLGITEDEAKLLLS